jgi:regulator of protease activity HflC (stomatin/prohibitin superfamily)
MRPSAAVSTLLLIVCVVVGGLLASGLQMSGSPPAFVGASALGGLFLGVVLASSVKVVAQWERMIVLRLGKFQGVADPGLRLLVPVFDTPMFVEMRVQTVPIAQQQAITQDNVPVVVNGVIFFKVVDPESAALKVQDYRAAIWRLAQATLRDVAGRLSLDELLSHQVRLETEMAKTSPRRRARGASRSTPSSSKTSPFRRSSRR